jgi:methylthioribose-1-phosphate isomerase
MSTPATACLQAIRYQRGSLLVLDQLRLPHEHHYDAVSTSEEAFDCIRSMRVRGAPAIAIVAALAHAVELNAGAHLASSSATPWPAQTVAYIESRLDYLYDSRPTAVDLGNAITHLKKVVREAAETASSSDTIVQAYIEAAEEIFRLDTETNKAIGAHGAAWLLENAPIASLSEQVSVLTHCNTGSLATSGHGTALGIVRSLHEQGKLSHAFCTETRPYNQGSRLTAFELVFENIPSTLITDSMAGALFNTRKQQDHIAAVIVGADRVVRNGDTANKIGTYALSVLARHHGVKFIVAAPTTSIDLRTETGAGIKIEERKKEELTQISGAVVDKNGNVDVSRTERVAIADQRIGVWNPAFDVTPAELIDAIVTEKGVVVKGPDGRFDFRDIMPERWADIVGN